MISPSITDQIKNISAPLISHLSKNRNIYTGAIAIAAFVFIVKMIRDTIYIFELDGRCRKIKCLISNLINVEKEEYKKVIEMDEKCGNKLIEKNSIIDSRGNIWVSDRIFNEYCKGLALSDNNFKPFHKNFWGVCCLGPNNKYYDDVKNDGLLLKKYNVVVICDSKFDKILLKKTRAIYGDESNWEIIQLAHIKSVEEKLKKENIPYTLIEKPGLAYITSYPGVLDPYLPKID